MLKLCRRGSYRYSKLVDFDVFKFLGIISRQNLRGRVSHRLLGYIGRIFYYGLSDSPTVPFWLIVCSVRSLVLGLVRPARPLLSQVFRSWKQLLSLKNSYSAEISEKYLGTLDWENFQSPYKGCARRIYRCIIGVSFANGEEEDEKYIFLGFQFAIFCSSTIFVV